MPAIMPAAAARVSRRFLVVAGMAVLALGAASCSLETDSAVHQKRVHLAAGPAYHSFAVAALDDAALRALADDYRRKGEGTLELTVTYDPRARANAALDATEQAARIARELRLYGVHDIATSILPVNAQREASQALVRYEAFTAHAPEGCDTMGGVDGKVTATSLDYGYGCTVETMLSRQIARPRDLAGRSGLDAADGRRQTAVTEGYRSGARPPALDGYSASD